MAIEDSIYTILEAHIRMYPYALGLLPYLRQSLNIQKFISDDGFDLRTFILTVNASLSCLGFIVGTAILDDGGWDRARKAGFTHKKWLTEGDNRVRDAHVKREGEKREIEERFSKQFKKGIAPMYPRDKKAEIEDIANCRCWLNYFIE